MRMYGKLHITIHAESRSRSSRCRSARKCRPAKRSLAFAGGEQKREKNEEKRTATRKREKGDSTYSTSILL